MPKPTQQQTDDPPTDTNAGTGPPRIRPTAAGDGAEMWRLARDSGGLDLNSSYAYLLYARDYADTCRVAAIDDRVVGFVVAHRPPPRPRSIFVWQVGVSPAARGRGIASAMIENLIDTLDVDALEATVAKSNATSRALFAGIARRRGAELTWHDFIRAEDFPDGHDAEPLLQIDLTRAG